MNEILATQIIAITTTVTMFLWLLFCPYSSKEFENYNKSRCLYMVGLIILALQYVVNMHFDYRATNIEYGITCNLFFYIPASYTFMLGMLNLQRAGNLRASKIRHGIGNTAFCYAILAAGMFWQGGRYQTLCNIICSANFFLCQTYFSIQLLNDYKHTKEKIDDYYAAEDHTSWMWRSNIMAIVSFLFMPIAIHINHLLTVFGICFWFAIIYYLAGFTYFGRYVSMVDDSFEADDEKPSQPANTAETMPADQPAEAEEAQKEPAAAPGLPAFDQALQQRIENWIAEGRYCDNSVNIVELAQELDTNRTTLSRHINSVLGMNFREWINGLRIEKAKALFREKPELSVEEVSSLCGFSTRKYFDQIFAAREGKTAAEWRKSTAQDKK